MMQLLSAWKESLLLFKPSNFKLFFLVTLKSCIDTLKVWFRYWWWLIGLVLIGQYLISNLLDYLVPVPGTWVVFYKPLFANEGSIYIYRLLSDWTYDYDMTQFPLVASGVLCVIVCLFSLLYVTLYLSARPSVAIKDWRYFLGYGKHLIYATLWFLLVSGITGGYVKCIPLVYLIFLLDSDGSLKSAGVSVWRAAKMVLYNAPFFVITTLCIALIYYAVEGLFLLGALGFDALCKAALFEQPVVRWILLGLLNSIDIFFMLILACFFVNYYIKKTHENYSLYFGK